MGWVQTGISSAQAYQNRLVQANLEIHQSPVDPLYHFK